MMALFLHDWQNFRKAERNVFLIVERGVFLLHSVLVLAGTELPLVDEYVFP